MEAYGHTAREKATFEKMREPLFKGPILLQESKITDRDNHLQTWVKMTTVRVIPAARGPRGGPSGGLIWLVPQNTGIRLVSEPTTIIEGLFGFI